MERYIAEATQKLVPDDHLDVIAFSCTSGAAAIGAKRVASLIHEVRPGIPVTDPVTAGKNGLRALGLERIALLTPYQAPVNEIILQSIEESGFEVVVKGGFFCRSGYEMSRISPRSILEAALELGSQKDVEGIFISCTAIRIAAVMEEMETSLGKPVVFSTQAMAWEALRLSGLQEHVPGRGRLLRLKEDY